jgi:hypothetical protein
MRSRYNLQQASASRQQRNRIEIKCEGCMEHLPGVTGWQPSGWQIIPVLISLAALTALGSYS